MMNQVPACVADVLDQSPYKRADASDILAFLSAEGIARDSAFGSFYRHFRGPFFSRKMGYELLDVTGGGETIAGNTRDCRHAHDFPDRYLAISNFIGAAILIYDKDSDQVFDVDFEGGDSELKAGTLAPRWRSFAEFLRDYFC